MGSIECGGLRRGELMEYPIGIRLFISQDPKPEVAEKGYQTYQAIRQTQQPVHGNGTVVGGADRRQRGNPRSHPRQGRHTAGVQTAFGMGQNMQLFLSCLLQYPYRPIPQGGAIGFDAARGCPDLRNRSGLPPLPAGRESFPNSKGVFCPWRPIHVPIESDTADRLPSFSLQTPFYWFYCSRKKGSCHGLYANSACSASNTAAASGNRRRNISSAGPVRSR